MYSRIPNTPRTPPQGVLFSQFYPQDLIVNSPF